MSIVIRNSTKNFISNFIGKKINSPEQRLIQGLTALALQPAIDYHNHRADKETRATSVARTVGKIIAGTLTGVTIRYLSIFLIKNFSQYTIQEIEKINGIEFVKRVIPKSKKNIFMPNINYQKPFLTAIEFAEKHNNHVKTVGTILACATMISTNFLIDAPLTKWITKILTPKIKKQITQENTPEANKNV